MCPGLTIYTPGLFHSAEQCVGQSHLVWIEQRPNMADLDIDALEDLIPEQSKWARHQFRLLGSPGPDRKSSMKSSPMLPSRSSPRCNISKLTVAWRQQPAGFGERAAWLEWFCGWHHEFGTGNWTFVTNFNSTTVAQSVFVRLPARFLLSAGLPFTVWTGQLMAPNECQVIGIIHICNAPNPAQLSCTVTRWSWPSRWLLDVKVWFVCHALTRAVFLPAFRRPSAASARWFPSRCTSR